MRRWLIFGMVAFILCGCKAVPEDVRQRRQEKSQQDMMRMPNGEESPFGS